MKHLHRTALLGVIILLVAAGCSSAFTPEVIAITDNVVVRTLRSYENGGSDIGPLYSLSLEVPADWVGDFETRTVGNRISFEYTAGPSSVNVPVFYIDALSEVQYWEQVGSYPGDYTNIANEIDTYFVYSLPLETSSTLAEEDFARYAAQVVDIVGTFEAEAIEE